VRYCALMLPKRVDLSAVVRDYIRRHRPRAKAELASFRDEPTLEAAIRRAALTKLAGGRRDPHHTRRSQELLERAEARLIERLPELETKKSFGRLYEVVDAAITFDWLDELYVYDTALRIGARRDLLPEVVYLHAGTRKGAAKLLDVKGRKTLFPFELSEVAPALSALEPYEIEDALCIYKDRLFGDEGELDEVPSCRPEENNDDIY
jgi:hypothetical protein